MRITLDTGRSYVCGLRVDGLSRTFSPVYFNSCISPGLNSFNYSTRFSSTQLSKYSQNRTLRLEIGLTPPIRTINPLLPPLERKALFGLDLQHFT